MWVDEVLMKYEKVTKVALSTRRRHDIEKERKKKAQEKEKDNEIKEEVTQAANKNVSERALRS